jgi:hypothetical protein
MVPKFAQLFESNVDRASPQQRRAMLAELSLTIHSAGINARHLGLVHAHLKRGGQAARLVMVRGLR